MKGRHRRILRELLSAPTAPFREEAVVAAVGRWAADRGVTMTRDAAGNVLARVRRGRPAMRWVFAAHMDHPGFVVLDGRGRRLRAEFRGGVARRYFRGARVRFFPPGGEVCARVLSARGVRPAGWVICTAELGRGADVPPGTIGMWDLPAMRLAGRRLFSRACDDVVGSAGVVAALDELASARTAVDVTGLLTRAEEAAFIGALGAARGRSVPTSAMVVAIETSRAMPAAGLGDGVVVRVGDRVRSFDPSLTAHVTAVAEALARRDRRFRHVRQLMPGGTCESTAYAMYGYTATGLCLPLANYHNQGANGRIASEAVDTGDFASLVKLLVALAVEKARPADTDARLKRRLEGLWRRRGRYLAREGRAGRPGRR